MFINDNELGKQSLEISLERKIEVLKASLIDMCDYLNKFPNGSCRIILENIKPNALDIDDVPIYFPEYDVDTALNLSQKYNFTPPVNDMWWWDKYDPEPRIAFMQALLTELELKLNKGGK